MKASLDNRVGKVLVGRWKTLLKIRKACLRNDDVDTVHDLRVATRRMRAALQLFKPFVPDLTSVINASIRRLTRQIGHLRNLDEALIFFQRTFPANYHDQPFSHLVRHLQIPRQEEAVRVRRLLKKLDVEAVQHAVKECAARLPQWQEQDCTKETACWPAFLSQHGLELFDAIHRHLPESLEPDAVQTRHALRIAIKRWRYFLEIVAELTKQDYDETFETLKAYQTLLGQLNDLSVFSGMAAEADLNDEERQALDGVTVGLSARYFHQFCELVQSHPLRYVFLI